MKKRLAIVITHPIQYYAPVFKLLHEGKKICIKVFYTLGIEQDSKYDPGFNKSVNWDIPLLDGYEHTSLLNISRNPGTRDFWGIINPDLINKINDWKPDAILVYGWAYHSHLKVLRYYKNKIPVYFRGDSTVLIEQRGIKKLTKYIFLRWIYSHVDHAIFVGINSKRYFKKYGLKESQLTFAPHAIDNNRFKLDRSIEANELRISLKIREEDIVILFAGKFEPIKNVGLLLSAFLNLNRLNAHLLLVGNGVNEQSLKAQAYESGKIDRIHFLDFKNQSYMPVLYHAADLFCMPSISESWGLAINEAMACGKAILASDKVGAAADLIKPGINGATFKSGELADLIVKLNDLLNNNKNGLLKMGQNSREIIENWNFENQVLAIESTINNE
jgi:glycosyltransferase involved in cell wall biosynthesis